MPRQGQGPRGPCFRLMRGACWMWKGARMRRRRRRRRRMRMRMQRVRILCFGCREKVAKHKSEQHEAHNKQIIERLERTNPPRPVGPQSSGQTSSQRSRRSVIMARRKLFQLPFLVRAMQIYIYLSNRNRNRNSSSNSRMASLEWLRVDSELGGSIQ